MTFEVSVIRITRADKKSRDPQSHWYVIQQESFCAYRYIASEFPMTLITSDTKVLKIKNGQVYPVARLLRKVCACHA